jgi:glycine/D-amino acid oxidase-like deaminating enzyme
MHPQQPENKIYIIGWGLAGATLAWQLHFRNQKFVIHDSGKNHSTRVAAGIVNPIVFKRLTKSWNADILMPSANDFYQKIAEILGVKLISKKNIFYPFTNTEDENDWSTKMGDGRFKNYLEHTSIKSIDGVQTPYGLGKVNTFGNLDTNLFLDHSKRYFEKSGIEFIAEKFDYSLAEKNESTSYIFCEGIEVTKNPLFNYLPMKSSHGETLIIESEELNFEDVISKNLFILPLGNNLFKVGATYNWDLQEPIPTELGKADLIERLENLIDCNYKIISHQAGIRPTVSDRRPLLGMHPMQKNAYIFNGLGTKGVMLAPYYAAHFANFFLNGAPLDAEVNIERFNKHFVKS